MTSTPEYLLPVEAYTSQDWFDREQRDLFSKVWTFACMTDALSEPGAYRAVEAGLNSILVVRAEDGQLHAHHNICRHRGARLLEGSGTVSRDIRCFYHSWAYSFDGALKRIPQADQFPDIDRDCLGLKPASVQAWKGMVFVHPDPDAQDLMAWLADFPEAMGPYEPEQLETNYVERFTVHANWKLFVENHIDGYHLWHLHSTSVTGLDHRQQAWRAIGPHWTFHEPARQRGVSATAALGFPRISGLPDKYEGSTVHLLFPNLGIASGAEYWLTLQIHPVAPDRTDCVVKLRTTPLSATDQVRAGVRSATTSVTSRFEQLQRRRAGKPDLHPSIGSITAEDKRAAESIQAAMASPAFEVGPMAKDHESAISEFQRNVLSHLDAAPVDPPRRRPAVDGAS